MTNDKAADLLKALAKKAGFTDEQVTLALSQPEWKEIENRDNRHSEYSSALDKAKNLEPLAAKAKEWDEWWGKKGGSKLYEENQRKEQLLSRFTERFGALDPDDTTDVRHAAKVTGMTMQQVQEMLDTQKNQIGLQFSQMTNELLAIQVDAANRGVKLTGDDVVAMNKLMAEKGVTYAAAYESHVGPRVREMEQQRLEKEKKDYAAEQVRDALTRAGVHNLPTASDSIPANFFDRPKTGIAEKSLSDQELLSMWNDSSPGKRAA